MKREEYKAIDGQLRQAANDARRDRRDYYNCAAGGWGDADPGDPCPATAALCAWRGVDEFPTIPAVITNRQCVPVYQWTRGDRRPHYRDGCKSLAHLRADCVVYSGATYCAADRAWARGVIGY